MLCTRCKADIPDNSIYCLQCGKKQVRQPRSSKRANGQGSVYQLPNKKWRAQKFLRYEIVPDTDPPRRRAVYATRSDFTKKVDALNYLPILGTEADIRPVKHSKNFEKTAKDKTLITLKELYDLWQPTHNKSKSTMNCYASGFAVFSDVWYVPMKDQDIDDLQECIDSSDKGRRTQENARAALGLVYKYGIPRGYVPANLAGEPNLAKFLKISDDKKEKKPGLSKTELDNLAQSVGVVPYADYVYCHCYLGFRPSAFISLQVSDYNEKERAFIGGIKTSAGIDRTVTVSPKILPIIESLIRSSKSGTVFENKDGTPLSIREYRQIFYEVLASCGIQDLSPPPHRLTPHSCRHTFATLMKAVKAPDTDKLALIGHTSDTMLREYQDVNYEDLRKITDMM